MKFRGHVTYHFCGARLSPTIHTQKLLSQVILLSATPQPDGKTLLSSVIFFSIAALNPEPQTASVTGPEVQRIYLFAPSSCSHSMEWMLHGVTDAECNHDIQQIETMVVFHVGPSPSILLGMTWQMCPQQMRAQVLTFMTFLPSLCSFMKTPDSHRTSYC